jgi:hypothetical protein
VRNRVSFIIIVLSRESELTLIDQDPLSRPFHQMEVAVVVAVEEEAHLPSVYFLQKGVVVVVVEVRAAQVERPMGSEVLSSQSCPCPLRVPNQLFGL